MRVSHPVRRWLECEIFFFAFVVHEAEHFPWLMFLFTAIPPVIMNALEKRAFMKVSGLHAWLSYCCLFSQWIYWICCCFCEAEKSPVAFHVLRHISDLSAWFTAFLWFCLPVAVPNSKRSSPGGARRSVVRKLHIIVSMVIFLRIRTLKGMYDTV